MENNQASCMDAETLLPNEKSTLTKTGNRTALLLVLVFIFSNVIQFLMVLPLVLNAEMKYKTIDPLLQKLILYIPTLIGIVLVILIARRILNQKIFENYAKPKTGMSLIVNGFLVCVGAGTFGTILSNIIVILFSCAGISTGMPNVTTSNNSAAATAVNIAYLCAIGPILEETLFRGMILKSLRKFGNLFAIISSSILFGIFHFNLFQLIPTILIGIILAYIAVQAESIVPSIIVHVFYNLFNVGLSMFATNIAQSIIGIINISLIIIAIVILVIGRKHIKIPDGVKSKMSGKQKTVAFYFRSWIFYVLVLIFIISCIVLSSAQSEFISKLG